MRGQVTGFAIVGILALIAVLGLVWLNRAGNAPTTPTKPSLDLETCIEQEAIAQVKLVGLNGGLDPDGTQLETSIDAPPYTNARIGLYGYEPGRFGYPDTNLTYTPGDLLGFVTFPPFDGPGATTPATKPMLTRRIETASETCADGLTIDTVNYSDDRIKIGGTLTQPNTSPQDVTVTLPIPLRTYHRAMREVLAQEATDPRFAVSSFTTAGDFRLTIQPNVAGTRDLLVLTSDRPVLGGEPFVYLTVIEDRWPVFTNTGGAEASLTCTASTPLGSTFHANDLVDPDDPDNTASSPSVRVLGCVAAGDPTNRYEISSGGATYEVTV